MIKNFQLYFCPSAFKAEAEAWRTVIHLNLARFVNYLHTLSNTTPSTLGTSTARDYRMLQMRLSPLKQVELILTRALSAETRSPSSPTRSRSDGDDQPGWHSTVSPPPPVPASAPDVSVRSGSGWKTLLRRRRGSQAKYPMMLEELDDARRILDACKEDIVALWKTSSACIVDESGLDVHHHAR